MSLNSTPTRQSIPLLDLTTRPPSLSGSQTLRSSSTSLSPTSLSPTSSTSLRASPTFKNIFKKSKKCSISLIPNSLESSPTRHSQIKCHQCRKSLIIDYTKELFLAIKCTCLQVPFYFCTRECHRAHWITMNTMTSPCLFYDFKEHLENNTTEFPLASKLEWTNIEYIHNLYHYKECILF